MTEADLSFSDLTGADVWNADFSGAKHYNTVMLCERIEESILQGSL
ncbi:pentapeptide repeat-containing protein [Paenibacillus sp. S3N08]|uniref:Pentapeptide repeat-containing protein n=1 Tax=Paenibacillus agricola TaxID=2716264 RepID=A0ABX0JGG2_9BACL|nr:pentapeptide repeat-containing protein [Paenibacillus agricola]